MKCWKVKEIYDVGRQQEGWLPEFKRLCTKSKQISNIYEQAAKQQKQQQITNT